MQLGEAADEELTRVLQHRLYSLLHPLSPHPTYFPGGQPVSFARHHLAAALLAADYYVCEKSDGRRFLLMLGQPPGGLAGFLIDRNWQVQVLPGWGLMGRDHSLERLHCDTVIDGELIETDPPQFLIFDILLLNGQPVFKLDLPDRLAKIQNHIIEPFQFMSNNVPGYSSPVQLIMKDMWKTYGIKELLDRVIPAQSHPNDGLIFTPVKEPYKAGTWKSLLKWKPAEWNTVDFQIGELIAGKWELLVGRHGRPEFYGYSGDAVLAKYKGKIVECRRQDNDWVYVRKRPDKLLPNDHSVAEKVLQSITDNVRKEDLYAILDDIFKNWKAREKGIPSIHLEWKSFEEYDLPPPGASKRLKREDDGESTSEAPLKYD